MQYALMFYDLHLILALMLPEGEGAMRFSFYYRRSFLLMHEALTASSIVV
jgi:hypothetical protein